MSILAVTGCGDSSQAEPDQATGWAGLNDPLSGLILERTSYIPSRGQALDPPLREEEAIDVDNSTEFPIVVNGVAYLVDKKGTIRAVRLRDRKTLWERATYSRKFGPPTDVLGPTYKNGHILVVFSGGQMVEVNAANGKVAWEYDLHLRLDTPPLIAADKIYIVAQKIYLVAERVKTGLFGWEVNGLTPIKSSPSFHEGRLFITETKGSVFCVAVGNGELLWRTNTNTTVSSDKPGFYSSPAIAFGRVYVARDDGTVFALDEKTGNIAWSFPTRSDLYGSPAVAKVPGTPPSVYVSSSDGHLYVLDALSGKQRWSYDFGEPLSGVPVVIGRTIYVSSARAGKTTGIDARTHRKGFELRQPGYTPIVSDGRQLYAIGSSELTGLEPTQR